MTDVELERRIRDWYQRDIPADETAPPGLRSRVRGIPAASPRSSRPLGDRRAFTLLAAATLVGLLAGAALVGALLTHEPAPPVGRIVFVRDGDLFTAEFDGSSQIRI